MRKLSRDDGNLLGTARGDDHCRRSTAARRKSSSDFLLADDSLGHGGEFFGLSETHRDLRNTRGS